jgi:hypothetical protein
MYPLVVIFCGIAEVVHWCSVFANDSAGNSAPPINGAYGDDCDLMPVFAFGQIPKIKAPVCGSFDESAESRLEQLPKAIEVAEVGPTDEKALLLSPTKFTPIDISQLLHHFLIRSRHGLVPLRHPDNNLHPVFNRHIVYVKDWRRGAEGNLRRKGTSSERNGAASR